MLHGIECPLLPPSSCLDGVFDDAAGLGVVVVGRDGDGGPAVSAEVGSGGGGAESAVVVEEEEEVVEAVSP